jgi:Skp family chaperone for outer membrane proteins
MKTTMKNRIYLILMIGISMSECFAGDAPSGVVNSNSLNPVNFNSQLGVQAWQSVLMQQQCMNQQEALRKDREEWEKKEAELIEQIKKDEALARQLAEDQELVHKHEQALQQREQELEQLIPQTYNNGNGIHADKMANYNNSTYLSGSLFKKFSTQFSRTAYNSSLFLVRCGNTYKEVYQENNNNSSLLDLSFFNTYEKGMTIGNNNSSRFALSIGDVVHIPKGDFNFGNDSNSTSVSIPISRDRLGALCVTAIAYKFGIFKVCCDAIGIAMPGIFVLPIVIGGTILFPVVMAVGGGLMVLGFTTVAVLTGAIATVGGALIPLSPLLLIAALMRR